jgi:ureidoacrylate peracid hydrolase
VKIRRSARKLLRSVRLTAGAADQRNPADQARVRTLLSPERCALVVVDVQNDFMHPAGRVGPGRADGVYAAALAVMNSLIGVARTAKVPVVFIRTEHDPANDPAPYRAVRARRSRSSEGTCLAGTWGAEFAVGLDGPRDGETVITKVGYDGFAPGTLAPLLAAQARDVVVVCGVATTLCVPATVAGAFEHGLNSIVPREATAASNAAAARTALQRIDWSYGDVVPAQLVLASWRAA